MDTATFSGAMKEQFIGPIRQVLHQGRVLLYGDEGGADPTNFKGIQGTAEGIDYVGNGFRIPIEAKRNQSVGFRLENETLPAPNSGEYTYIEDHLRYAYGLFNITGPLLKAAASNQGAFATAFQAGMDSTTTQCKLNMNRAAFNDSTGTLTTATTASGAATTIPVASTINFRGGEVVDIVSTGGTYRVNGATVLSVSRTPGSLSVTIDTAPTGVAVGDLFVSASTDSTSAVPNNSLNKEINGLGNIVNTGNVLHGLNPSTYTFWNSYVQSSTGAISDAVLRNALDQVGFNTGLDLEGNSNYALVTTRGIRANYAQTLTALKRFNDAQSVKLHGGFTAVMFDENPIFIDDMCPVGTVYGLSMDKLLWIRGQDWSWMEEDGKVLKWEPRRDSYVSVLYTYLNLGTTHRGAHFKLTGVTDPNQR